MGRAQGAAHPNFEKERPYRRRLKSSLGLFAEQFYYAERRKGQNNQRITAFYLLVNLLAAENVSAI